jgi:hypothetical protein
MGQRGTAPAGILMSCGQQAAGASGVYRLAFGLIDKTC